MKNLTLKDQIKGMIERATILNGRTLDGKDLATAVGQRLKDSLAAMDDEAQNKASVKLHQEAMHDPDKRRELCRLRIQTTENYILASNNFFRLFFNVVSLADDEAPIIQNNTTQEIRVGYVGQEGSPECIKVLKPQAEQQVALALVSTDKVRYRLRDIYSGDISQSAIKTVHLAFDMANKLDALCYNLMTASVVNGGAFGTFTFTGNKASRIWLANSRILAANLPTTNDITVTGTTGSTKFRSAVFAAIGAYAAKFTGAFPGGDLFPTGEVLVPAGDIYDLADEILPTGSTSNPVADSLLTGGPIRLGSYLGRPWVLIPDNTIASGICYARYNKSAGTAFLKSSWDQEFVDTEPMKNEEARWQQKAFGAAIAGPNRLNVARFTYKS